MIIALKRRYNKVPHSFNEARPRIEKGKEIKLSGKDRLKDPRCFGSSRGFKLNKVLEFSSKEAAKNSLQHSDYDFGWRYQNNDYYVNSVIYLLAELEEDSSGVYCNIFSYSSDLNFIYKMALLASLGFSSVFAGKLSPSQISSVWLLFDILSDGASIEDFIEEKIGEFVSSRNNKNIQCGIKYDVGNTEITITEYGKAYGDSYDVEDYYHFDIDRIGSTDYKFDGSLSVINFLSKESVDDIAGLSVNGHLLTLPNYFLTNSITVHYFGEFD